MGCGSSAKRGSPYASNLKENTKPSKSDVPSADVKLEPPPKIHAAAKDGNLDEVRELIKAGEPIGNTDKAGLTQLHWASCKGHQDIVSLLLESNAALNQQLSSCGSSPLHQAAGLGHKDVMQVLLDAKADTNLLDK